MEFREVLKRLAIDVFEDVRDADDGLVVDPNRVVTVLFDIFARRQRKVLLGDFLRKDGVTVLAPALAARLTVRIVWPVHIENYSGQGKRIVLPTVVDRLIRPPREARPAQMCANRERRWSRRSVLTATTALLAGCTGEESERTDDPQRSASTETTSENPTATDSQSPSAGTETTTSAGDDPKDIVFRETPEATLKLDLYLPDDSGTHPFVVFAHGGAWILGDKGYRPMFGRLTAHGYAVADIQYRLAQQERYPGPVRDVVAAVKWVRDNAGEYDIDASRGALAGYSAGAHLAMLVGLAPDHERFQPPEYKRDVPAAVDAVVGYSGPYDFTTPESAGNPLVERFFGPDASEATLAEGSPVTHVDPDDPPVMLVHGTDDSIVPYRSTTVLADALRNVDVPVEVITGDGAGHGMIDNSDWREQTLPSQVEFLDAHLDGTG